MSVSSVKNLNGEVFSAVQDASLTNVVQTNSASWGQGGGGGTTVVSGIDNGLIYISAEDAGAIYGKPYNGTYNGFFSAIKDATITNNSVSISCPETTIITRIAADSYDYYKYKTSPNGEWIGPVHQFDVECEFVSNNGVVVIPISSNNYYGKAYFSAYENLDITNKIVIPPFIDVEGFVKKSDSKLEIGKGASATSESFALGYNSAYNQSFAQGYKNSAYSQSFAQGSTNSAYNYSLAQGSYNSANNYSLAQGEYNKPNNHSLAQGNNNSAYNYSLSQGSTNSAYNYSLAQGNYNSAFYYSLAQGYYTSAYNYSLVQGYYNKANNYSLAQGYYTSASNCSQAFGYYTSANNSGMAIGVFNKNTSAAFVVGNGTWGNRSDAFIIYRDGSVSAAGKISANGVELGAGGGGGDAEVNNYVYTNSAAINGTVSTYQTNSASYITELPDEEEVEFEEINLSSFATSSQVDYLSGAIDYVSANAGGTDWTDAISSLSGQINEISGTLSGKHTLSAGEGISFYEDNENNITRIDCTATGGGTSYTGDAQGALDKVYANSGNWISTLDNAASALFFAHEVSVGNRSYYGPILSATSEHTYSTGSFDIRPSNLILGIDYGNGNYSGSFNASGLSGYGTGNWNAGNFNWHLDYRGLGGTFSDLDSNKTTWSALRNVDLGLTTGSTVSSISGHSLAVGDVSNIVLTSTLPATPDANTLYLIPEV